MIEMLLVFGIVIILIVMTKFGFRKAFASEIYDTVVDCLAYILWVLCHIFVKLLTSLYRICKWNYLLLVRTLRDIVLRTFRHSCVEFEELDELRMLVNRIKREGGRIPKHVSLVVINYDNVWSLRGLFTKGSKYLKTLVFLNSPKQNVFPSDERYVNCNDSISDSLGNLNLKNVSEVLVWLFAIGINMVTLYDYHGAMKAQHRELRRHLERQLEKYQRKQHLELKSTGFRFYNVNANRKQSAGDISSRYHVCLTSYEDGKSGFIQVTKSLLNELFEQRRKHSNFSVTESLSKLDIVEIDRRINDHLDLKYIPKEFKTEPDLLLVLGDVMSTLGFLPWHIRLTEIQWMPSLWKLRCNNLASALLKFSRSEKRFGR